MKYTYLKPEVRILPLRLSAALCESTGSTDSGLGGDGDGDDPWSGSHAPQFIP